MAVTLPPGTFRGLNAARASVVTRLGPGFHRPGDSFMSSSLFDASLTLPAAMVLLLALGIAFAFEFVNGFHDTANAVATVIYTQSLAPRKAVVWSGFCNFLGVYLGGTAVAFSIVNLLPVDLLVEGKAGASLAMVLALLLAAITWNLGTWFLAIPASSSHTLIGSILGVGMANALMSGRPLGSSVNWTKAGEVGLSLMISPMVGFLSAGLLLLTMRQTVRNPALFEPPATDAPPPFWVRSTLLATCTGVSFAHGSNDGQKGIGLVMLILIGLLPAQFALNPDHHAGTAARVVAAGEAVVPLLDRYGAETEKTHLIDDLSWVHSHLRGQTTLAAVPHEIRWKVRARLIEVERALQSISAKPGQELSDYEQDQIKEAREAFRHAIYYAPTWVLIAVATALGVGTMIGWKRIVTTVGEKIGKSHLTYAQGAAAEVVAACTISLADLGGLPVSTTHVLSSGVAGTMAANRSGLQFGTVRNIAMAWVLTMPVSMSLAAILFAVLRPLLAGFGGEINP